MAVEDLGMRAIPRQWHAGEHFSNRTCHVLARMHPRYLVDRSQLRALVRDRPDMLAVQSHFGVKSLNELLDYFGLPLITSAEFYRLCRVWSDRNAETV